MLEVTGYTDAVNVKVRERNQICILLFEPEQLGVFIVWFFKITVV